MLEKVNDIFHEQKVFFHVFFFFASHIMSSYFGFETCVRCRDDRQKVLEMHTL